MMALLVLIASCSEKEPVIEGFNGIAQGTTYSIVYDDNKNIDPDDLKSEVEKILSDFDKSLSIYEDSSILSRINRNEDVVMDEYFLTAWSRSLEIYELTNGAFDITVGQLVSAWGFGPDEMRNFNESIRDSLLRLTGMQKVKLEDRKIIKEDPGIILDFNAIAQGYSVDVIYDFMEEKGLKNFLVEIGGEVRVKGTKGGQLWRIGIDRPTDNNVIPGNDLKAVIRISDQSLATSGNYRKFYVENGVKYSHTINPHTGNPAKNNLLSVTIVADDCATADGIATACMVMGLEDAKEFIERNPQFSGYFIYSDEQGNFQTWISESLKDRVFDNDQAQ